MAEHCVTEQLAGREDIARSRRWTLGEATEYCRHLAAAHYENFSVLGWFLPARLVPHFAAVYAYCRCADDLADELRDADQSLRRLDAWQRQLEACYTGGAAAHPVFVALSATIKEFAIPPDPFLRLLDAFRQDQRQTRYATHEDVLAYCRRSADPVGRLVLYLGRCHDEARGQLADSISTGLQLANFCQDVARDYAQGRIYLPQSMLDRFGYDEAMFEHGETNDAFRRVLACEVDRAEAYLLAGAGLQDTIAEELRLPLALFVGGGLHILSEIRKLDYDVWRRRPVVSRWAKANLAWRAWWRARRSRSREGNR